VLAKIIEKTGIKISLKTLKRICKRAGFNWKRIKKTLKQKKNETDYQKSVDMIAQLIDREEQGFRKIYFISMNQVLIFNHLFHMLGKKKENKFSFFVHTVKN